MRVAVIGRGIIGLGIATRLVDDGHSVILLGERFRPGSASWAAHGLSSTKGVYAARSPLFAAKVDGHRRLEAYIRRMELCTGRSVPMVTGVCEPFFSDAEYRRQRQRVFGRAFTGLCRFTVERPGARAWPFPPTPYLGHWWYPDDIWIGVGALCDALDTYLSAHRGVTVVGSNVARLTMAGPGIHLSMMSGETLRVDSTVVAMGAFANELLTASNLPPLPLKQSSGRVIHARAKNPLGTISPAAIRHGKSLFVASASQIVHGPLKDDDAAAVDSRWTGFWGKIQPSPPWTSAETREGVRAAGPGQKPLIGPWPPTTTVQLQDTSPRLLVAVGHYKSGLQLMEGTAGAIAGMLSDSKIPQPFSEFIPRHSTGCGYLCQS